ncbi:MAG: copper oxidase, partial [Propionibacteriaceae bacterium]|nr:copper oxidase [Propionibacteriaceae bacterium]
MSENGRPVGRTRRLRDHVALGWLAAALVLTVVHRWVPASSWLMVHLVLLGALSHSALVWSEHFAHTLLRSLPDEAGRRRQSVRIGLLGIGSLLVFVGVPGEWWWLVVVGACLVSAAVLWHAAHLVHVLRGSLPNRFRVVTRYYIAASLCLPVGAGLGATLAFGLSEELHGRILTGHMSLNLLGWVGLTVTGTLVTFWPTLLRTRMDERAETLARQALPLLVGGLVVLVAGGLAGWRPVALAGLALYVAGLVWWGRALVVPLRAKGLREFAPASVLAALVWAIVGLAWVGWLLATTGSWAAVTDASFTLAAVFAVGFAAQLLFGALSYLIPSVMGGGPSVVRAGQAWFDRWALWRLVVVNAGLLLWLFPSPSWVRVTVSSLVTFALAAFLPLLVQGAKASARARRAVLSGDRPGGAGGAGGEAGRPEPQRRLWSGGQAIAAVAALVLAITVGVGVDPAAAGLPTNLAAPTASEVVPTGNTTRVEVTADGMAFTPNRITVPAGDRLVIVLRNADATTAHDLVVGTARTPRLQPGDTAELDAGVIGASTQGWCTVAGHRQMGMVLGIVVEGEAADVAPEVGVGTGGSEGHGGHAAAGRIPAVPDATLSQVVDPVLA